MHKITLFYIFLLALVTSLAMIPPISKLAVGMGILDRPGDRKIHAEGKPRLGGIAIFFAFILTVILFSEIDRQVRGLLAGAIIIFLTGMADDLSGLSPGQKVAGQTIAALAAIFIGDIRLTSLGDLFGRGEVGLGVLSVPFTLIAIVGVTNAANLLDGLDGLAGGVTVIAVTAIAILAYQGGNDQIMGMSVALAGATLGFLKYNTYPASIFMGDSGSLFLGYCLGVFSVVIVVQNKGEIAEVTPLIILAVPILDTVYVMAKRLKAGKSPFIPDNKHIHHRFLERGADEKKTVIIVYVFTYLLAAVAVGYHHLPNYKLLVILVLAYSFIYFAFDFLSKGKSEPLPANSKSRKDTRFHRRLVQISRRLKITMKYLLVVVLFLSIFLPSSPNREVAVVSILLLVFSAWLIFVTTGWGNRFLLFVMYFDSAFVIYQMENLGRTVTLFRLPLVHYAHLLFLCLFIMGVAEVFLRKRTGKLLNSPLEFLILFAVISVPFFPDDVTSSHHLLTVAGESVIMFAGYKLTLMRQARLNRKIILATLVALLVVAVKGF